MRRGADGDSGRRVVRRPLTLLMLLSVGSMFAMALIYVHVAEYDIVGDGNGHWLQMPWASKDVEDDLAAVNTGQADNADTVIVKYIHHRQHGVAVANDDLLFVGGAEEANGTALYYYYGDSEGDDSAEKDGYAVDETDAANLDTPTPENDVESEEDLAVAEYAPSDCGAIDDEDAPNDTTAEDDTRPEDSEYDSSAANVTVTQSADYFDESAGDQVEDGDAEHLSEDDGTDYPSINDEGNDDNAEAEAEGDVAPKKPAAPRPRPTVTSRSASPKPSPSPQYYPPPSPPSSSTSPPPPSVPAPRSPPPSPPPPVYKSTPAKSPSNTSPPPVQKAWQAPLCSADQKGIWLSKKSSSGTRTNLWCPVSCRYGRFQDDRSVMVLANTKIFFMGNSHVRNLFRCATDLLSRGKAMEYQPKADCSDPNVVSDDNHCLSCLNMGKARVDYGVHTRQFNIDTAFFWTSLWEPTRSEVRRKCVSGAYAGSAAEMECIINEGTYPGWYIGAHLGNDVLHQRLASMFRAEPLAYFVFNYFANLNSFENLERLLRLMSKITNGRTGETMKDRAIFVMDPREKEDVGLRFRQIFDSYGVTVLDARSLWTRYYSTKMPRASLGPLMRHNHLTAVGNTILANQLLTLIADKKIQQKPWVWRSATLPNQLQCKA